MAQYLNSIKYTVELVCVFVFHLENSRLILVSNHIITIFPKAANKDGHAFRALIILNKLEFFISFIRNGIDDVSIII